MRQCSYSQLLDTEMNLFCLDSVLVNKKGVQPICSFPVCLKKKQNDDRSVANELSSFCHQEQIDLLHTFLVHYLDRIDSFMYLKVYCLKVH